MPLPGAHDRIARVVRSWKGVTEHPHDRGGTEFRLGDREIGHVHGDEVADIPFPRDLAKSLVASGRADPHKVLAKSVSAYLNEPADIERAIELFEQSFQRQRRRRFRLLRLFTR